MGPGSDHVTRTLLLSSKQNTTLLVSRGSDSNVDSLAEDIKSGHSQIKAFDVANLPDQNGNDYNTKGKLLGWGLRNSVGVAEHPVTGGIYSVENSVDEIERDGKDIHQDNPGEELNFHGYLANNNYTEQGGNYGYPLCFAASDVDSIPNKGGLAVGKQFVLGNPNDTVNDDFCANERVSPRLTFQPHQAPLDIKFTSDGNEAYVSFHGSWSVRTYPARVTPRSALIFFPQGPFRPVRLQALRRVLCQRFASRGCGQQDRREGRHDQSG